MRAPKILLLLCALLSSVLAAEEDPVAKWYGESQITDLPFFRPELLKAGKLPYTTVRDLWRQSQAKSEGQSLTSEWHIPVSTLYGSQETARRMRRAWQRLEERYYWYTMSRLGLPNFLPCLLSSDSLNPPLPEVKVSLLKEFLPPGHTPGVGEAPVASAGETRLDNYTYYWLQRASVAPGDFCDGLYQSPLDLVPAFLPTVCFRFGWEVCFGPTYLSDLGNARIQSGIERLGKVFIPEYGRDILEALKPRVGTGTLDQDYFNPTLWSGVLLGEGAVVTPVVDVSPSAPVRAANALKEIVELINSAQFADEKLNAARWPYFHRGVLEAARRLSLPLPKLEVPSSSLVDTALAALNGKEYRNPSVRGIWPLEEIKRRFPPASYQLHESLGYTSYFQAFGRLEATVLPDPNARWGSGEYPGIAFMRSLHFWDVPVVYGPCPPTYICEVKPPRPYMVPPYILPYAGPRYLWDWVSVPEGYPIPRVRGKPTFIPVQR